MENKLIAGTILKQLGGNKFIAMTGAKNLMAIDNGMCCKIGRNSKNVNYLRVKLNSLDTYDMEFINIRSHKLTVKSEAKGVYCDMLQEVFTSHTGMNTRL